MKVIHWMLSSVLFVIIKEANCIAPSSSRFTRQDTCIALVAKHHFGTNSAVAVLTTDSHLYQRPTKSSLKSAPSQHTLIELLSRSTLFSFLLLKPDENDSYCSYEVSGKKLVDYYIFTGNLHGIDSFIKTFCFDKLTHDRSNFVIYLQMNTSYSRNAVENVLELFWNHQHQNVIVLVDSHAGEIDVYSWFPLAEKPHVQIVDQCNGTAFRYGTRKRICAFDGRTSVHSS